jgi:hypothetical protein
VTSVARRYSSGSTYEKLRIDRRHRIVDPDVDRAELALHHLRRGFDLFGVGNVGGEDERLSAALDDLGRYALQACLTAGEERDLRAVVGKPARCRAADPARSTGDDDDIAHRLYRFRRLEEAKPA